MLEMDLEAREPQTGMAGQREAVRENGTEGDRAFPPNWYLVAESFRIGSNPIRARVAAHDLVLYRRRDRSPVALTGVCTHLGASLARGKVEDDCIVCPFHGWAYDSTGQCKKIPSQDRIPEFGRLKSYPVIERAGLTFVHLGETAPGPEALSAPPEEFASLSSSRMFSLEVGVSWQMIAANGFDANHFESVHGRKPLSDPRIRYPDASSIEVTHEYLLTSKHWTDRLVSFLLGGKLSLRYRVVGGTRVFAETTWGRISNQMLFSLIPAGDSSCTVVGAILSPGRGPLARLRRAFQRRLTIAFFRREVAELDGAKLNLDRLVESDRVLRTFYTWLFERRGTVS